MFLRYFTVFNFRRLGGKVNLGGENKISPDDFILVPSLLTVNNTNIIGKLGMKVNS